jgi:hypothetical protein
MARTKSRTTKKTTKRATKKPARKTPKAAAKKKTAQPESIATKAMDLLRAWSPVRYSGR